MRKKRNLVVTLWRPPPQRATKELAYQKYFETMFEINDLKIGHLHEMAEESGAGEGRGKIVEIESGVFIERMRGRNSV